MDEAVDGQFRLFDAFVQGEIAINAGHGDELSGPAWAKVRELATASFSKRPETIGTAGLPIFLDLDHVVAHPRRARPSIRGGADHHVALLGGLPDDGRRGRVVAGRCRN